MTPDEGPPTVVTKLEGDGRLIRDTAGRRPPCDAVRITVRVMVVPDDTANPLAEQLLAGVHTGTSRDWHRLARQMACDFSTLTLITSRQRRLQVSAEGSY